MDTFFAHISTALGPWVLYVNKNTDQIWPKLFVTFLYFARIFTVFTIFGRLTPLHTNIYIPCSTGVRILKMAA